MTHGQSFSDTMSAHSSQKFGPGRLPQCRVERATGAGDGVETAKEVRVSARRLAPQRRRVGRCREGEWAGGR